MMMLRKMEFLSSPTICSKFFITSLYKGNKRKDKNPSPKKSKSIFNSGTGASFNALTSAWIMKGRLGLPELLICGLLNRSFPKKSR